MKLFTQSQYDRLIENGKPENRDKDHAPVVKLFLPGANAAFLLNELDITQPMAFGLCDLGHGCPELRYVDLDELFNLTTPWGTTVERDEYFEGQYPMSIYSEAARICEYVTTDDELLQRLAIAKKNQFQLKLE